MQINRNHLSEGQAGGLDFPRSRGEKIGDGQRVDGDFMEELIARVAASAGIEPEVAQQVIAAIFSFLQKEGPQAQVASVLAQVPGAQEAANTAEGPGLGGLMGLASQLMGMGLGIGELQSAGKEIFGYVRERAGDDTIREIAAAIPGLSQFI
jgi:hypothetical protein